MKQRDLYEQIEAYLSQSLAPEEVQAFEQRMAEDEVLRQEVAIHRQLQQDFDAGRLQLRTHLKDIMQEPLQTNASLTPIVNNNWWRWLVLFGFVLGGIVLVWQWQTPVQLPPATPKIAPTIINPVPDTSPAPDSPQTIRPMAKIDPKRFKPNPGMEAFVASNVRSESIAVTMRRPVNGVRLVPDAGGSVQVRFSGTVEWPEGYQPASLVLSFFDNTNANTPLLTAPLKTQKTTGNNWPFDQPQALKWSPGLYYFTIEEKDKGEVLYAGKFLIDK